MHSCICTIIGKDTGGLTLAERAVRSVLPRVKVRLFGALDEALNEEPGLEPELLILTEPEARQAEKATAALNSGGRQRWAIVVLSNQPATKGVETVLLEHANEKQLGQIISLVFAHHQSEQENARLRGDLRTISHRIMHDLRTPLGAILGAADGLRELLVEQETTSAPLMRSLLESGIEMQRLMERVSLLTRASANPVAKTKVQMEEVIFRATQRLESRLQRRGVKSILAPTWPEVEGMANWLEIIWTSLVMQVLPEAMPSAQIELNWTQVSGGLRFYVREPESKLANSKAGAFFQPFDLLHSNNTSGSLELSIVQRLVELQGGRCSVEFPAEGGICLSFTLPAEQD